MPIAIKYIYRQNYGFGNTTIFAIPYSYADSPKEGSEFNNPILTMCLTIISYLIDKREKTTYINQQFNTFIISSCLSKETNSNNAIFVELIKLFREEKNLGLFIKSKKIALIKNKFLIFLSKKLTSTVE
jgi:hypothetical protein